LAASRLDLVAGVGDGVGVYFSPELTCNRERSDVVIESVALTGDPASIGLRPVTVIPGDLRDAGVRATWHNRTLCRPMLERAAAACQRRHGGAIVIEDPTAAARPTRFDDRLWIDGRGEPVATETRGGYVTVDGQVLQLEHRPAGRIIGVR